MLAFYIILGVIGFLIIIFLILLFSVYWAVFESPKKWQLNDLEIEKSLQYQGYEKDIINLVKQMKSIPCEDAYIKSYDRLKLHARIYPNEKSNKVAILFHGYRGTACRDFSGGAKELINMGLNVVLIDQRAHGLSKGHSITFGRKEQKDVISWIKYSKERFGLDKEVILVGISMGAATVLFAANKINNVKIIADCPYSSEKSILQLAIKRMRLPTNFFFHIVNLASILFSHANLNIDNAIKTVGESYNKILIIHGDNDHVVPINESKIIYESNKDKVQYEVFHGAEHGMSYLADTERYVSIIEDFLSDK